MKNWMLALMLAFSLLAGYVCSARSVQAAVPNPCPQYQCKTVHAIWPGVGSVQAYFQVNMANANSSDGIEDIFTPNSIEKKPRAANGKLDVWLFNSCSPQCGKDANGKWQAKQEVAEAGMGMKSMISVNINRNPCSSNNGANGPTNANPSNLNTEGNNPPGVDTNGDPIVDGGTGMGDPPPPPPPPPPGG